jgi:hypothetical protein
MATSATFALIWAVSPNDAFGKVTGKDAVVFPWGTVTEEGTPTFESFELRLTSHPPAGAAGRVSVTVPLHGSPGRTGAGENVKLESSGYKIAQTIPTSFEPPTLHVPLKLPAESIVTPESGPNPTCCR